MRSKSYKKVHYFERFLTHRREGSSLPEGARLVYEDNDWVEIEFNGIKSFYIETTYVYDIDEWTRVRESESPDLQDGERLECVKEYFYINGLAVDERTYDACAVGMCVDVVDGRRIVLPEAQ